MIDSLPIDYCDVDYSDYNYPYGNIPSDPLHYFPYHTNDVVLKFYNPDSITYNWTDNLIPENRLIQIWDQQERNPLAVKNQNKGNFINDTVYNYIPIYAVDSGAVRHLFPSDFYLNIEIKHSTVISKLISNPTIISLKDGARLTLDSNKVLDVVEAPPFTDSAYFITEFEANSGLILESGSHFILRKGNKLVLDFNSRLYLGNNAQLSVKSGAFLYNYGASLRGNGRIVFDYADILNQLADFLIEDSVKFILNDSAVVSIPNNTTIHIKGNTTSLIMNPGSKLLFGENSGIVCDSGGKLIANNATFASIDSTKKWNGISLSGLSQDTFKNCTIKNASSGISISNKYDSEESPFPYSTEISGCTFINQTAYVLNSAVYIAGSNNILIMNNTISSVILEKGFTHGIYAEYCPEGAFNIIGNNISNSGFGMTLIGCSPFVAQNILTGNEYSDCGLFLDNSNGTFEYNVISDFYYSYFSYYSSPDLLKNVFDNYYDDNIWLSSSSVPVMHPLINAGSVYWYAGDNTIKGSPSNSGIIFEEDAYPMLNYGYNKFMMTNNDYYISGTNPSGGNREFYVIQNYWGGTPDSNKFNVYNADVIYIPFYSSGVYFCILETENFNETRRMILLK